MKNHIKSWHCFFAGILFTFFIPLPVKAQSQELSPVVVTDSMEGKDLRPVKNTFEGMWLIDNQTVMVPVKGTFEFAIQHRFGTIQNGYDDFWGLYASSNIRLGFSYVVAKDLMLSFGFCKQNITWDFDAKYAILRQARSGGWPFSLTYYGNAAIDTRDKSNFVHSTDRYSFFNQLILARKVTDKFSVQVSPSLSHFNAVESFYNENGELTPKMENTHFAIAFGGRYKVSTSLAIIANYDQPITQHYTDNPHPNISFGLEIGTSSHTFQVFCGNYYFITPQRNNMFNQNDYTHGDFLIGFNITRLWN